jgi:hypothetical protein
MERGKLAVENSAITAVIFEDFVAKCPKSWQERLALSARAWAIAYDCWVVDPTICKYLSRLIDVHRRPVEVYTWHGPQFARLINDDLYQRSVFVRGVTPAHSYEDLSASLAIDTDVNVVYDPDPMHRLGYGFKCRDFDLGQYF